MTTVTMKIHCFHFLLVGNFYTFDVGQGADEVPKFKIELIDYISSAMNPTYAFVEGQQLPQNIEKLEELRSAAKDYVSGNWKKPDEGPAPLKGRIAGRVLYPKNRVPSSWTNVIPLDTVPEMYLRAAEKENEFVIMIVYDSIEFDEKYVFNVDITTIDPFLSSNVQHNGALEDRRNSSVFSNYPFLKFLHICIKALDHVQHLVSEVKVDSINLKTAAMESPEVGHHLSKLNQYNYEEGKLEEHIALECPITPNLYIYPKPSSTDFQVLIVAKINK